MNRTLEITNRHPIGHILSLEFIVPNTARSPGTLRRRTSPRGVSLGRGETVDLAAVLECTFEEAKDAFESSPRAKDLRRKGWLKVTESGVDEAMIKKAKAASEIGESASVKAAKEAEASAAKVRAEAKEEEAKAAEASKTAKAEKAAQVVAKAQAAAVAGPKKKASKKTPSKKKAAKKTSSKKKAAKKSDVLPEAQKAEEVPAKPGKKVEGD